MKTPLTKLAIAAGVLALTLHPAYTSAQEDAAATPPPPQIGSLVEGLSAEGSAPASPAGPAAAPGAPAAAGAATGVAGATANPNATAPVNRMEQFRQRMNDQVKATLQPSDQEWTVVQPMLSTVQDKMFASMRSRLAGAPRPNHRAGAATGSSPAAAPDPAATPHPDGPTVAEALAALRTALETEGTSNSEIKAKMEALRGARKKTDEDLAKARANLKSVLALRQEANLVLMGLLD